MDKRFKNRLKLFALSCYKNKYKITSAFDRRLVIAMVESIKIFLQVSEPDIKLIATVLRILCNDFKGLCDRTCVEAFELLHLLLSYGYEDSRGVFRLMQSMIPIITRTSKQSNNLISDFEHDDNNDFMQISKDEDSDDDMVDYDVDVELGEFLIDPNDVSDDEGTNNTNNKMSQQAETNLYPTAMVAE